jgi:hypothetical protein
MTSDLNEIHLSDYEILLKVKKDKYFLSIPEFGMIASDNSLERAYQSLAVKKEAFLKELQEAELTLPKKESSPITGPALTKKFATNNLRDNVLGFIIKMVMVGVVLIIVIGVSSAKLNVIADTQITKLTSLINKTSTDLDNKSRQALIQLKTIIPSKPGRKLEKELIRAAEKEVDPERQEKIIKGIRALLKKWKPVINEVRPLFEE